MPDNEQLLAVRLEASLTKFEKQLAKANKSAATHSTDIERRFKRMGTNTRNSALGAAGGLQRLSNISGGSRFVLQNTAAQLGDIAVQLESGTAASRVMAQQLPQVFGGFSALGGALGVVGPLLGTVAAVAIPAAAMLLTFGGNSEESAEKVRTLEEKIRDVENAITAADKALQMASIGGVDQIREKYGKLTTEIRELVSELADLEKRAAAEQLAGLFDGGALQTLGEQIGAALDGSTSGVASVALDVDPAQVERVKHAVNEMADQIVALKGAGEDIPEALSLAFRTATEHLALLEGDFGKIGNLAETLGPSQDVLAKYRELETVLREALSAEEFGKVADALRHMQQLARSLGVELDDGANRELLESESLARQFAATLEDSEANAEGVGGAASQIAPQIASANVEAMALVGNLQAAMAALAGIVSSVAKSQRAALAVSQIKMNTIGDPTARASALARNSFMERNAEMINAAFEAGNHELVGEIRRRALELGESAGQVAAAEEQLKEAEAAYKKSLKPGKKGGGGSKSKDKSPLEHLRASAEAEIASMERRIEMIGKTDAQVAALTLRYRLLDEAKRRSIDLDKVQAGSSMTLREEIEQNVKTMERLAASYEQAQEKAQFLDQQQANLKNGILDAIVEGENFIGVLGNIAKAFARAALEAALFNSGPMASGTGGGLLGGLLGGLFANAKGNAFVSGAPVQAFASGGIVNGPTIFPMRGGTGLMGEAGPEAIMPLTRMANGKLGVQSNAGGGQIVVRLLVPDSVTVEQAETIAGGIAVQVMQDSNVRRDAGFNQRARAANADPKAR